jgi:hypothetical protein
MSQVNISNYPIHLNMNEFRAAMDQYGGLAKAARYAVRIIPTGQYVRNISPIIQDLSYLCEVAEMPGRGLMNIDLRYYGPNQKFPFQTQFEDLNLTFLCRSQSLERQFFDDWMLVINPNNSWDFNYKDDYSAQIEIFQFSEVGDDEEEPMATYKFTCRNAFPLQVSPQPVTWQDDQFQRVIVTFTFDSWSRDGLDPEPDSFSLVTGANRQIERSPIISR